MAGLGLRVGVVLPADVAAGPTARLAEFVTSIETLGLHHLTLFDHVLGAELTNREPSLRVAFDYRTGFREPLVLCGYLAAITTGLEFATGVLALPQRQTALVAKQAAEVALLSDNRLRLGVGVGLNPVESAALGADFSTRGARQEEQVQLLKLLWSSDVVNFAGSWDRVDRAGIAPLPSRPIPIWFGGAADIALRRSAALGDGHIAVVHGASDLHIIERVTNLAHAAGKPHFGIEALIDLPAERADFPTLLAALLAAGVTHVTLRVDHVPGVLGIIEAFIQAAQAARATT